MPNETDFPAAVEKITYRVRDDDSSIIIQATVGAAQRGVPVAFLDENTEVSGKVIPGGKEFDFGSASELIGRVARIQTFVSDVNANTDLTIVNYDLCGGVQSLMDNTQKDAEEPGGRVGHFFFITFAV